MEPVLKAYLQEAMEVEKAGLEVTYKKISEFIVPRRVTKQVSCNPRF